MTKYLTKEQAIEGRRKKDNERYIKNREERIKKQKLWDLENKEKRKINSKNQWEKIKNDPVRFQKYKEKAKRFRQKRRFEILNYYSNGKMECNCCKENTNEFLSIDHINNDGAEHRKTVDGSRLYCWLRNNNYPAGFQVLCHNCNMAKGIYGKCPHSCPVV